jgi:hypothetical protein
MTIKLFFHNCTRQDLSDCGRAISTCLSSFEINRYTTQQALIALKDRAPTCILSFVGQENSMRLVLSCSDSVTAAAREAINSAVRSVQPSLPAAFSAIEHAPIITPLKVTTFRLSGLALASGESVYTLEVTLNKEGEPHGVMIHSIELDEEQALELNELNPGAYGDRPVAENLNVLTDSALCSTLSQLGCRPTSGLRRRYALVQGAQAAQRAGGQNPPELFDPDPER